MDMSGEQIIPAPRDMVWAALNDPEILKQAIPGCEVIEKHSDTELSATVVAKVGPVKATFKGKVTLSDIDAPNGYTISGEGQGGAAGFGKGGAKVSLTEVPEGTKLSYTANAQVGGKLAQIGARLVDGAAKKMADDFFVRFNEIVAARAAAAPAAPEVQATAQSAIPETPAAQPAPSTPAPVAAGGIPAWIWIGGLIVVVLVATWLFQRG